MPFFASIDLGLFMTKVIRNQHLALRTSSGKNYLIPTSIIRKRKNLYILCNARTLTILPLQQIQN